MHWVNKEWNVGIVGIPYKGGGPIAQELVAGQLQLAKMGVGNFIGLLATGKIKPLAVAAPKRSPLLPEVPTFVEAGLNYPGFGWWGLAAPKGTPSRSSTGSTRNSSSCSRSRKRLSSSTSRLSFRRQ